MKKPLKVGNNYLFKLTRLIGLFPLDNEGKFSKIVIFRGVLFWGFLSFVMIYTKTYSNETNSHSMRWLLSLVIDFASTIPMIAYLIYSARKSYIQRLRSFVLRLERENIVDYSKDTFYSCLGRFIMVYLLIMCVWHVVTCKSVAEFHTVLHYTSVDITSCISCLICLHYRAMLNSSTNLVKKLIWTIKYQKQISIHKEEAVSYISRFSYLLTSIKEIDGLFNVLLLMMLTQGMILIIMPAFEVFRSAVTQSLTHIKEALLAVHILFQWFKIFAILSACENFKAVSEEFYAELFKIMKENKELCCNSKLRLYVTMKPTVVFTACGFFQLGYPLITSILAAATTYLVVLIQFSLNFREN